MVGEERECPSLLAAVHEANEDRKKVSTWGIARRLETAATLLERQDARASIALIRDAEALDSDVQPLHVQIIPGRCLSLSLLSCLSPSNCLLSSASISIRLRP